MQLEIRQCFGPYFLLALIIRKALKEAIRDLTDNLKDAEMFYRKLRERLAKFSLELAEEKSRIISFSFRGIEFCWGISNSGKDVIKRRTDILRKSEDQIWLNISSVRRHISFF